MRKHLALDLHIRGKRPVCIAKKLRIGINECAIIERLTAERTFLLIYETRSGFQPAFVCHPPGASFFLLVLRDMLSDGIRRRFRNTLNPAVQALPEFFGFHRNRQELRFTRTLQLLRAARAFHFLILRRDLCIDIGDRFEAQKLLAGHTFRPDSLHDAVQLRFNAPRLAVVLPVFTVQLDNPPARGAPLPRRQPCRTGSSGVHW